MSSSTEFFGVARRSRRTLDGIGTALRAALEWPGRIYRARQLMHQLGHMGDRELRDIGLTRLDLLDVTALAFDADPSLTLCRRVEERRRRR